MAPRRIRKACLARRASYKHRPTEERGIKTEASISHEVVGQADMRSTERELSRLVAQAYAADHPEAFGAKEPETGRESCDTIPFRLAKDDK